MTKIDMKTIGLDFQECEACWKKTGACPLCKGCRHNRQVIKKLLEDLANCRRVLSVVRDTINLVHP